MNLFRNELFTVGNRCGTCASSGLGDAMMISSISHNLYSLSISLFWMARLLFLPVFGSYSDKGNYTVSFYCSLFLGAVGEMVFSLGAVTQCAH